MPGFVTGILVAALCAACASAGPLPPDVLIGGCGPARGLTARYLLPYTPGDAYTLTQGNCGEASHGGRFSYSFDFRMPMGTPVLAARDGVVMTVREDQPDGTRSVGDENFVIIRHADGEMSRYIHLSHNGVRVEEGERVAAGDTIALSGNSGQSSFPHLHFDVADECGRDGCTTIPSAFLNADPPIPHRRRPVRAEAVQGES